jgi:hypothetical protein
LRIFSEVTYIRTVGNSTLLKIYTLPNHTITIGVCILETQLLGLLYGRGASFVQKMLHAVDADKYIGPFSINTLISMGYTQYRQTGGLSIANRDKKVRSALTASLSVFYVSEKTAIQWYNRNTIE